MGLDKSTTAQMILLALTNIAYILYLLISRPFIIHINTIFSIVWSGILITTEVFLIYFNLNNGNLLSSEKTRITFPLLVTISVFLMLLIIWSIWRAVWQFMDIWNFFKSTEFYKHYGDPDIEVES